jgi:hypothetical protein
LLKFLNLNSFGEPILLKAQRKRNNPLITVKTLKGQSNLLIFALCAFALLAFVAAIATTNNRIQIFQKLAAVAVPSVNATNEAFQLLSAEVSNTADYILAGQGKSSSSVGLENTNNVVTNAGIQKAQILKQIETQRAAYDQALQTGFTSLTSSEITSSPDPRTALKYVSSRNARLQDALAQARGLADNGNFNEAIKTYLFGQNEHYLPVISSLYYLRSQHIFLLEDAQTDANDAARIIQTLSILAVGMLALVLLIISIWLSLRVKRIMIPLINLSLVAVAFYAFLLWNVFNTSNRDLNSVLDSYNRNALISDAKLYVTDMFADQVQWIISNKDPVFAEDFKKKQELVLITRDNTNKPVYEPGSIQPCPISTSQRNQYKLEGALGETCRRFTGDNELVVFNQIVSSYQSWLTINSRFETLVKDNRMDEALNLRSGDGAKLFNQIIKSLNDLQNLSLAKYEASNKSATDGLNSAFTLAMVTFPFALALGISGILLWRREF